MSVQREARSWPRRPTPEIAGHGKAGQGICQLRQEIPGIHGPTCGLAQAVALRSGKGNVTMSADLAEVLKARADILK